MNIEHRRYTGPLRWDVCAECKEPWPCGPAVFHCELDTITAELTPQCTAERPFGPCTQRCEQPAGHDGQHRAQCFTWCCDQHVPDACAPDEGAHQADDYPRPCCEQCPNGEAA